MIMDIIFIIILVWIVNYFIVSLIQTNSYTDITNNLNKIYISTIMALLVSFVYVLLLDFKFNKLSCNYYIGIGLVVGLLTYAYRNQLGVNQYDWANTMIEYNSNNLLVNKFMASETSALNNVDMACVKLANQLVNLNQEQINILKQLRNNLKSNGVFY
jgi:hypothetical protein